MTRVIWTPDFEVTGIFDSRKFPRASSKTDFATSTGIVVSFMVDSSSLNWGFHMAHNFGTKMPIKLWEESISSIKPSGHPITHLMVCDGQTSKGGVN